MAEPAADDVRAAGPASGRRSMLRAGLGAGAAVLAAGAITRANASDPDGPKGMPQPAGDPGVSPPGDPEWSQMLGPGIGDRVYGSPSRYEADVIRRNVPWLTANA